MSALTQLIDVAELGEMTSESVAVLVSEVPSDVASYIYQLETMDTSGEQLAKQPTTVSNTSVDDVTVSATETDTDQLLVSTSGQKKATVLPETVQVGELVVEEFGKPPESMEIAVPLVEEPVGKHFVCRPVIMKVDQKLIDEAEQLPEENTSCLVLDDNAPSKELSKLSEEVSVGVIVELDVAETDTAAQSSVNINSTEPVEDIETIAGEQDSSNNRQENSEVFDNHLPSAKFGTNDISRDNESVNAVQHVNNTVVDSLELDMESLSHCELKLSLSRVEQRFDSFRHLDRPANVVIDLRHPKLVPVYSTVCEDHLLVGPNCETGMLNGEPRRPQTAIRGRNKRQRGVSQRGLHTECVLSSDDGNQKLRPLFSSCDIGMTSHSADIVPPVCAVSSDVNNQTNHDTMNADSLLTPSFGASTIIHLKFIDIAIDQPVMPSYCTSHEQMFTETNLEHGVEPLVPSKECTSYNVQHVNKKCKPVVREMSPESSDEESMRVRNVNRTYGRNSFVSQANRIQSTRETDASTHDELHYVKTSMIHKEKSPPHSTSLPTLRSQKSPIMPLGHLKTKSSSSTLKKRPRIRIGPAWYSRKYLSSPPDDLWDHLLTTMSFSCLKKANYVNGLRHRPLGTHQPMWHQQLQVLTSEQPELSPVGEERLVLWRMSETDIDELQSQLRREADHRRSEHIMPLVMQMTSDQIEHAYEGVAESMKTYEIVAADSDEEEEVEEELDDVDGGLDDELLATPALVSEREPSVGETEYMRNRPKRLAVDYGPSAFTPILLMEGRRVFVARKQSRKHSASEETGSKRNCRRSTKNSSDNQPLSDSEMNAGQTTSNGHRKPDDGDLETASPKNPDVDKDFNVNNVTTNATDDYCIMATMQVERCGVFDCIASPAAARSSGGSDTNISSSVCQVSKMTPAAASNSSLTAALLPRSSPPPDLGLPMAPRADMTCAGLTDPPLPILQVEAAAISVSHIVEPTQFNDTSDIASTEHCNLLPLSTDSS